MMKGILIGVLVIGIVIVVLVVFMFSSDEPSAEIPEVAVCGQDSDCVKVAAGCCDCNNGGIASVINKDYVDTWNDKIAIDCVDTSCIAAISDHVSCSAEPKCVGGRCTLA